MHFVDESFLLSSMPKMFLTRFNTAGIFILILLFFTSFFCKTERKPPPAYGFDIDSLVTSIKSDSSLNADDVTFDNNDSLLIVYLVPTIQSSDSGILRSHFKSLHITSAIRRSKNISGLVFVKTPPKDSLTSKNYQYQILASFFKAGTRFAEKK